MFCDGKPCLADNGVASDPWIDQDSEGSMGAFEIGGGGGMLLRREGEEEGAVGIKVSHGNGHRTFTETTWSSRNDSSWRTTARKHDNGQVDRDLKSNCAPIGAVTSQDRGE